MIPFDGLATILTTRVLPLSAGDAAALACDWTSIPSGRAVCAANVHMVMEAHDDPRFAALLSRADLVVCDGRPLVWAARLQGLREAQHCRGLDLTLRVCELAVHRGLSIGLYGGEPAVTDAVQRLLAQRFPGLNIVYHWSPPFRQLSPEEDAAAVNEISAAAPDILFVSLGCPRQEQWMLEHREQVDCVMLGVGAVFDMIAGRIGVAPRWMQRAGLEWVFRLIRDPKRLWRRYAKHNVRYAVLVLLELHRQRRRRPGPC